MLASNQEIFSILRQYNPWWETSKVPDIPKWERAVFKELFSWIYNPPTHRAVILSGARQTGKTTLFLQAIQSLLEKGVKPEQILYATFDHPILKLIGLDELIKFWREIYPASSKTSYLFIDEIQYTDNWQTWIKHQVDFDKNQKIAATGSAVPLTTENVESGVGRWHTIKLPTLSFYEYLRIKEISFPNLPQVTSFLDLFNMPDNERMKISEMARPLIGHFHDYILRGGFPQTALVENINIAQKLLREDIVDKVLKRDMTALFGVRRILELEKTFLYLCLHDGGILDMPKLCESLDLKKPTVTKFLELFEASHLIYKLPPHGYGKQILRARYKVYLADAAISGSVLLKGKSLLEDTTKLGAAVETAFFKHVYTRYYQSSIGFFYWRNKRGQEVDVIAEVDGRIIPFEVKYQKSEIKLKDLKGLQLLIKERKLNQAYAITRDITDFGVLNIENSKSQILKIPAPLACFWLSQSEVKGNPQ